MQTQTALQRNRKVVIAICRDTHRDRNLACLLEVRDLVQEADVYLWERQAIIEAADNPTALIRRLTKQAIINCLRTVGRGYIPTIDLSSTEAA